MKLPLAYYGNPLLRKKAEPIGEITEAIRQLAADMIETMDANNGIGLAAPQIGQSIRLFVLRRYAVQEDGTRVITDPYVYINPKIVEHSEEEESEEEGCLSIPKIRMQVSRPKRIKVEATDLEGKAFTHDLEGINARVVMHENDHINGVLFIDRVRGAARKRIEDELRQIKKKLGN